MARQRVGPEEASGNSPVRSGDGDGDGVGRGLHDGHSTVPGRLGRLIHGLPLVLPAVAVVAVALAVLVIGRPRAVIGVRVRGGPTVDVRALSLRLEAVERLGDLERPLRGRQFTVNLDRGGAATHFSGTLDAEGTRELVLSVVGQGAVHAQVQLDDSTVEGGRWSLTVDDWKRGARRRGGWVERRFDGGLVLRAAAERGVFAVPFAGGLWVLATRNGNVVPAALDVRGDGADVRGPLGARSDGPGAALDSTPLGPRRYMVTPREHAAVVQVRSADDPAAQLDVSLAVIPGALYAELVDRELIVRSPVLRERAYVAIVSEGQRIVGATVSLEADGTGASGVLGNLTLPDGVPLWAVVSSEPGLRSASLVGWPIRPRVVTGEPPTTFDVPDALVLDTIPDAVAREQQRQRRVRVLSILIAVVALTGTAASVAARAARARAALELHLQAAGADHETTASVSAPGSAGIWYLLSALLCLALAALLIALFASITH